MTAKVQKISFLRLLVSQKNRNFALVIELQRHIEILLLNNDCVIVPDFGGFVAHYISARYSEEDNVFLPPLRTLGFNPQLRINDSLLVQSYINAYDISYPEALHRINDEVEEMRDTLDTEGHYDLENIGNLTINDEGNYQFEPCEAGILSPELYGLGSYEFLTLQEARTAVIPVVSTSPASILTPEPSDDNNADAPVLLDFTDDDTEQRAIRIKMSWIRNAVAVAAAVIAFFFMATPIANSNLGTRTMSQLQHNLLNKLMPQDTNMTPATPVVADKVASVTVTADEAATATEVVPEKTAATAATKETADYVKPEEKPQLPVYCIVLASQVKRNNAEYYVEQLRKQGISDAEVYVHNHIVRVTCGSFETEGEAYRQLNKMNNKSAEFAEAWVYKKTHPSES